jgi:ubiquinone/menaquinone biosynthesis C-methylase UbiE
MSFYQKILKKVLKKNLISLEDHVLVVAGGERDRETFSNCGFKDVTITNLDYHEGIQNYSPYKWKKEDVENLTFQDGEFDWVFVHSGLHHCASPHKGLCEMLRVSKKGVGVFESRDNVLNNIANKFDLAPSYEIEPCVLSNGKFGGVRNSHIPNFVYKWTENEVQKTTKSYIPEFKHNFYFYYGLLVPTKRLAMSKSIFKKSLAYLGKIILPLFTLLFKKQGNLFAFIIEKNIELQPWLKNEDDKILFNLDYSKEKFSPKSYSYE